MAYNLLDVLEDDINNLDLTRSYVYVLELVDNRYYIGRTSNFIQRMNEHFIEGGALYTKKYKPIKIKEVVEETSKYDERDKTLEYMHRYGWENVRGYAWCRENLSKMPKVKRNNKEGREEECVTIDNPEIRNMYMLENKDIIDIGKYLNISPGSVAYNLEKMGIVERRQLSRGYFDYIFSDLYDFYKKDRKFSNDNVLKKSNKRGPKPKIAKTELSNDELNNVKPRIHDIIKEFKN